MNFIINNIVKNLHDDNEFYQILEVNHEEGFVRVKDLAMNAEFRITVSQEVEYW